MVHAAAAGCTRQRAGTQPAGAVRARHTSGIHPAKSLISDEENINRITQLLQQRPDTDGIFATVERLALSSYHACRRLGLSIPQTVKIIGFSNMEAAALLAPSLTTITQPAYAIGQEAARILLQALTKRRPILPSHSLELKSELIERASTGNA